MGLLMDGSLTLVGGLVLRSLLSGLSSVKQSRHITPQHYLFSDGMCPNNDIVITEAKGIYTFCRCWTTFLHC